MTDAPGWSISRSAVTNRATETLGLAPQPGPGARGVSHVGARTAPGSLSGAIVSDGSVRDREPGCSRPERVVQVQVPQGPLVLSRGRHDVTEEEDLLGQDLIGQWFMRMRVGIRHDTTLGGRVVRAHDLSGGRRPYSLRALCSRVGRAPGGRVDDERAAMARDHLGRGVS